MDPSSVIFNQTGSLGKLTSNDQKCGHKQNVAKRDGVINPQTHYFNQF